MNVKELKPNDLGAALFEAGLSSLSAELSYPMPNYTQSYALIIYSLSHLHATKCWWEGEIISFGLPQNYFEW